MSTRSEIDILVREAGSAPLTAEHVVEKARDAEKFPALNEHLWRVPEAELAAEARLARAHKLLIRIRVVSDEGTVTRMLMHTRGTKGYRPVDQITSNIDLASVKLKQLTADISRARQRLSAFRSFLPMDVADDIDASLKRAEESASKPLARMTA